MTYFEVYLMFVLINLFLVLIALRLGATESRIAALIIAVAPVVNAVVLPSMCTVIYRRAKVLHRHNVAIAAYKFTPGCESLTPKIFGDHFILNLTDSNWTMTHKPDETTIVVKPGTEVRIEGDKITVLIDYITYSPHTKKETKFIVGAILELKQVLYQLKQVRDLSRIFGKVFA